jgi:hypothetical protein
MRTAARRRLDVALLGGTGLVVGAAAAIGGVVGDREHVRSLWAGAELADSGSAAIVEVVDYDFGFQTGKHGIYRDVPGLDPNARIEVSSPDAPADLAVLATPVDSPSYPATRLRIGDPDRTVTGERRYVIAYDLDGIAPAGQLRWDAVGAAWTVPIDTATVEVVAPWRFVDVRCVAGTTGSTDPCPVEQPEPGHLVATVPSLDPGEGVTLFATAGEPVTPVRELQPPVGVSGDEPGTGAAAPAAVATVATLGAAAVTSRIVRRAGRERVRTGGAADVAWAASGGPDGNGSERRVDSAELASLATIEFAPPRELTTTQGGVVLTETVRPEHKVAWLIGEAIDGSIELVDAEEGARRGKGVRLRRADFGDPGAAPVLNAIFDGRPEVELGSYDEQFAIGWAQLDEELEHWSAASGLWDTAADHRRTRVRVLGVLAAAAGAALVVLGSVVAVRSGPLWLGAVAVGAVLAGAGASATLRGWELRVRTPEGAGLWLRVESFRRFLAASEGYHAEQAAARGVLREYTAWAVALGEVDRWSRAVGAAANVPDRSALTYVYLAPALLSATSSASTAPSSSSGGGGGGVGGGGGGGGGGSW